MQLGFSCAYMVDRKYCFASIDHRFKNFRLPQMGVGGGGSDASQNPKYSSYFRALYYCKGGAIFF